MSQRLQLFSQFPCARITAIALLGQQPPEQRIQRLRQRRIHLGGRLDGSAQDAIEDRPPWSDPGTPAGRSSFRRKQPPSENRSRPRVERFTARLLGRHVGDGPDHFTAARDEISGFGLQVVERRVLDARDTEVEDLRVTARRHEDVRRLDIAVDDALARAPLPARRPAATPSSSARSSASGPRTSRSLSVSPLSSSITMNGVLGVLRKVVDRTDVGMVERRRRTRLAAETGEVFAAASEIRAAAF